MRWLDQDRFECGCLPGLLGCCDRSRKLMIESDPQTLKEFMLVMMLLMMVMMSMMSVVFPYTCFLTYSFSTRLAYVIRKYFHYLSRARVIVLHESSILATSYIILSPAALLLEKRSYGQALSESPAPLV